MPATAIYKDGGFFVNPGDLLLENQDILIFEKLRRYPIKKIYPLDQYNTLGRCFCVPKNTLFAVILDIKWLISRLLSLSLKDQSGDSGIS